MIKRENRRSRRAPVREERSQVLIVCGGRVTEPSYFRGLKKWRRNPAITVMVEGRGVDPASLIRFASAKRDLVGYDQVWCVLDVDEFDLSRTVTAARQNDVQLAISNPCFEYWLLLHFELCVAPLVGYGDVKRRLTNHLPEYHKSHLRFIDFANGVDDAIKRAQTRCTVVGNEHACNPSTGVWALVQQII